MNMSTEKYKQAWEAFQKKMAVLEKKRLEILTRISEKLDKQRIEVLQKKLKGHG